VRLVIEVVDIQGNCPVYMVGDRFTLDQGYVLNPKESDNVCMHSLASVIPYYTALSRGVSPEDLGLSGSVAGRAYVQCLDPCKITGGGTVVLEIRKE